MIAAIPIGEQIFTCRTCKAVRVVDLPAVIRSARDFAEAQDAAFAVVAGEGWTQAGRGVLCPAHRKPEPLADVIPIDKNMPRPAKAEREADATGTATPLCAADSANPTGPGQPISTVPRTARASAVPEGGASLTPLPGRAGSPQAQARPGLLARAVAWLRRVRWPWKRRGRHRRAEFETHPVGASRWVA